MQHRLFKFSMFISRIILGPFLKSVTQITTIFSSNFKSDRALVKLVLLFVLCGFGLAAFKVFSTNVALLIVPEVIVDNSTADSEYYRDQSETIDYLIAPQINSNVIERKVVEVFVPITSYERYLYKTTCQNLLALEDPERQERRNAELACFANFHTFSVDGQQIPADVIKTQHSVTGQFGIMAYLNLDSFVKNGYYNVVVKKSIHDEAKRWQIPFYYAH